MRWRRIAGNLLVVLVCIGTILEVRAGEVVGSYVGAAVCLVFWGMHIANWWEKLK